MRIAVLGAGAWGTALAIAFSRNHDVVLWSRESSEIASLRQDGENRRYLPGIALPSGLQFSDDLDVAAQADLHLVVTPLAGLRSTARALRTAAPATPLLWACKGLEAGTAKLPHQIVEEELGADAPCGVLTGPSFAAEVAQGLPAAVTIAARDIAFARHWVQVLHNNRLRLYANDDLIGAEVGGAVKNVMAIAAGVADGMGFVGSHCAACRHIPFSRAAARGSIRSRPLHLDAWRRVYQPWPAAAVASGHQVGNVSWIGRSGQRRGGLIHAKRGMVLAEELCRRPPRDFGARHSRNGGQRL